MIKVMGYELKGNRIDCLYDEHTWLWFIINQGHSACYSSFEEASERMDEAIQELNNSYN